MNFYVFESMKIAQIYAQVNLYAFKNNIMNFCFWMHEKVSLPYKGIKKDTWA